MAAMHFPAPLTEVTLLRRYKRFLADVRLPSGEQITVHCANPGSMLGMAQPGARAFISDSGNPARKLRHSLELVEAGGALVGVHTGRANGLAEEAIKGGVVAELRDYAHVRREVKYGAASRVDFVLSGDGRADCYVEVKSVTLSRTPSLAEFPDSVSARAARHMDELALMVAQGHRAVVLFVVQRSDCHSFAPAADLDPACDAALDRARKAGVQMLVYGCDVSPEQIRIARPLAFS